MNLGLGVLGLLLSNHGCFDSVPPVDSPTAVIDGLGMVPIELRRGNLPVDVFPAADNLICRAPSKCAFTGCGVSSSVSGTAGIPPRDCRLIRCVLVGVFLTFFGNSSPGFKIRVVVVPSAFRIITLR